MATIETIHRASQGATAKARFSLSTALAWLETQLERRRSRRALLEMSDEQLKDLGISRGEAYREGYRSFFD